MKKLIGSGLLAAAVAAPLSASAADTVDWFNWTGLTGTAVQNGTNIDATFTATSLGLTHADYFTGEDDAYLSAEVTNGPGTDGMFSFAGGTEVVHHVHFSKAVVNPYLAIVSLGSEATAASFNFANVSSITLVSEGDGYYGDGELSIAGGTITGFEGHGVVRLNGTFTDLYFTTPDNEYWYGASFGIPVSAVPEPGTWAMLAMGGAVLGLVGRRRKQGRPA
ncbi:PEP-CTERM sorting domain-containing protein [Massilia sp. METH4]|uniref:PEP-CTERM sorting domain-containing protein n=1 Tax=Massilia sp. METH4 TaxID=3123041 RepID=UPI0030CD72E4